MRMPPTTLPPLTRSGLAAAEGKHSWRAGLTLSSLVLSLR